MRFIENKIYKWDSSHLLKCGSSDNDRLYYSDYVALQAKSVVFNGKVGGSVGSGIFREATIEETNWFLHCQMLEEYIEFEEFLKLEIFYECY